MGLPHMNPHEPVVEVARRILSAREKEVAPT
jgi:hypothetical protein